MKSGHHILCAVLLLGGLAAGCDTSHSAEENKTMKGSVQFLSPEGMHKNPAFSQAVVATGNVKTVYIGGQNAVSAEGQIVGKGDIAAQIQQVVKNIETVLAAAAAKPEHVIKWNIHIVQGQSARAVFEIFHRAWGNRPAPPPTITVLYVASLAHPDFLIEIDGVSIVPIE